MCQRAYGADAGRGASSRAARKRRAPPSPAPCRTRKAARCPAWPSRSPAAPRAIPLTAVTDAEGRFVFAIVRPDTYTLTAALQGFKTLERTNLVVNANDRLSAGILALEVGAMTEEVTVSTRVSELQTTSGERSFALENSALQNIANNGRARCSTSPRCVPGALPQRQRRRRNRLGQRLHRQRPARRTRTTMSIDGVANIDTGDNGGNMATTNIDAVAEFKVLTNAYQAEYGRAVGAQLQVVTKSGSRDFHGSGYWYGRRSDWNANTLDQQAQHARDAEGQDQAQRLGLHRRRPDLRRPASTRTRRSCSSSSARSTSAGSRTTPSAETRVPDGARAPRRLLAERRQQRQPVPVHPRLHDRPAAAAPPTRAAASRTAACSAASRPTASTRPASRS